MKGKLTALFMTYVIVVEFCRGDTFRQSPPVSLSNRN